MQKLQRAIFVKCFCVPNGSLWLYCFLALSTVFSYLYYNICRFYKFKHNFEFCRLFFAACMQWLGVFLRGVSNIPPNVIIRQHNDANRLIDPCNSKCMEFWWSLYSEYFRLLTTVYIYIYIY